MKFDICLSHWSTEQIQFLCILATCSPYCMYSWNLPSCKFLRSNLWYSLKTYGDLETVTLNMFRVFSVNLFVIVKADSWSELYRRYAGRF